MSQCCCVMCESVRVGHAHADTMKAQRIRDAETRRKLCVVCMERPRPPLSDLYCLRCKQEWINCKTPAGGSIEWAARRARAFERRRWKAKGRAVRK